MHAHAQVLEEGRHAQRLEMQWPILKGCSGLLSLWLYYIALYLLRMLPAGSPPGFVGDRRAQSTLP